MLNSQLCPPYLPLLPKIRALWTAELWTSEKWPCNLIQFSVNLTWNALCPWMICNYWWYLQKYDRWQIVCFVGSLSHRLRLGHAVLILTSCPENITKSSRGVRRAILPHNLPVKVKSPNECRWWWLRKLEGRRLWACHINHTEIIIYLKNSNDI